MSTNLTILTTAIRQDAEGRYCLNDCHKASGGDASKAPGQWMANKQTKALIAELKGGVEIPTGPSGSPGISSHPINVVNDGKNNGTYVAKELVYAYAMWISPAFHLRVIRAFDAMTTGAAPTLPKTYAQALLAAAHAEQERERLAEENAVLAPKAEALDKLATLDGVHNLRSAAQQCGWPEKIFISRLMELKWLYSHTVSGRKLAYADKVKAGLIEVKNVEVKRAGYVEGVGQPMITQKGLSQLRILLGTYIAPGKNAPVPFSRPKEAAS
ncbi:KilA-N domain-containing protein [Asaia bogorensis]|uniref:KilA-N domain-containing protein n=1 Tax=Asaia bogorensis TaxID=91915 RepID=UPI0028604A77|nr:KilA-N domain-containing protein [Asaia bogorensis]MDR6182050.1 phage antirepressor YoqD-like protein [Asaia bogorensis NBRC 16594]